MISPSTSAELSQLLSDHFDVEVCLVEGHYSMMELHGSTFFLYRSPSPDDGEYQGGKIIAEQTGDGLVVLGSILTLLIDFPILTLRNRTRLERITFGEDVQIDESDGHYLVRDEFNRLIAWGVITRGKFTPMIDRGSFLRYES